MKIIGIRCGKDQVQWAVLEGESRDALTILGQGQPTAPVGERSEQLAWVRREVLEVFNRHHPDLATVRVVEGGGQGAPNLGRAEVEGVVQAALAEAGLNVKRLYAVSLRAAFSARTKAELDMATASHPCVTQVPKVRREVIVAAVAGFPA